MAGITYRGEKFSGYNKPKRTPGKSKSHAVLIKDNGKIGIDKNTKQLIEQISNKINIYLTDIDKKEIIDLYNTINDDL